eukprot:8108487-Pyramimonas_sp.AAC.1
MFWGAGKGRSAIDCAWLQAARSEADRSGGMHSWMWVIDWSKCYESIPLRDLRYKRLRVGIPTRWLKLVINTWCGPRIIRSGRHHAVEALHATNGLPAGDGNADIGIKIHAAFELDSFASRCPTVDFLSYIDDGAIGSSSRDITVANGTAVESMRGSRQTSDELNAVLNFDKVSLIASSVGLGHAICDELGVPRSTYKTSVTYLGVGESSGAQGSAKGARPQQQRRLISAKRRIGKVRGFKKGFRGCSKEAPF